MKSRPSSFPANWRGRLSVKARRVSLRPRGLSWVMSATRKFEKALLIDGRS